MSAPPTDGRGPWEKFLCRACGLIYDEAEGDPDSGLPPGTRFSDIPEDWSCPLCGVTKADFEPYTAPVALARPSVSPAPRMHAAGIVVLGAGSAGWAMVEALRALDAQIAITLVTACAGDRYNKPELSVALSRGATPESLCRETGAAAASRLGLRLLAHTTATGLDPAAQRLRTTRGTLLYGRLVLAQGARPALPPSLPPDLCWRVNDLLAWSGLHRALGECPRRVAVVGAGMVGCELAEDLARAGHAVTLLDTGALPLAGLLPEVAGRRLAAGLATLGIRFHGGLAVARVTREEAGPIRLETCCGLTVEADLVLAATGLATEPRLARSAGLAFDRGLVVSPETLQTSAPGVYALGDCISLGGQPCRYVEPLARQAEAIAHAVLGRPHSGYVHAPPVIRLKTRCVPLVLHGAPVPGGTWRVIEDTARRLAMEQWHGADLVARLAA